MFDPPGRFEPLAPGPPSIVGIASAPGPAPTGGFGIPAEPDVDDDAGTPGIAGTPTGGVCGVTCTDGDCIGYGAVCGGMPGAGFANGVDLASCVAYGRVPGAGVGYADGGNSAELGSV